MLLAPGRCARGAGTTNGSNVAAIAVTSTLSSLPLGAASTARQPRCIAQPWTSTTGDGCLAASGIDAPSCEPSRLGGRDAGSHASGTNSTEPTIATTSPNRQRPAPAIPQAVSRTPYA